jgi:hypothetical protein
MIISDFPMIFAEFRGKQFSLLWRGSRDGFSAHNFHSRCDGHANTLTVILDTDGNIFGGFTPVEWDSENHTKADPSLKSFLFTLRNPHNVPARRFFLKAGKNEWAIVGQADRGPYFDDLCISANCNRNTSSYTKFFGYSTGRYLNDTGLEGKTFFTGSEYFQVKEVEVFEIIV